MHWEVQLTGENGDLQALAASFASGPIQIHVQGNECVLVASEFAGLEEAGAVRDRARIIVAAMSGAARVQLGLRTPLGVAAAYQVRDDGKRDITIFPEPAVVHVRAGLAATVVTRADGSTEVRRPADPVVTWTETALSDPAVAQALRWRDVTDPTWSDLYKVLEVIQADGGARIQSLGWATKAEVTRFTRTANSVTAGGVGGRHGVEKQEPPPDPMTPAEGRRLIDRILTAWLTWKAGQRRPATEDVRRDE